MCRALGVNRTSFHDWERRPPTARAETDAWLTEKIKQIHEASRGVYGAPRIHAQLRMGHGIRVGRKRVERLMQATGISGLAPRKRARTTIRVAGVRVADDLVEWRFRPPAPSLLWLADITYLRSWEGLLYLAAVQDAYSRAIVGWSMVAHMRAELVLDALKMALARPRPDPGARAPLRPGQPGRQSRLRSGRARRWHRSLDGLQRRRLRQRRRRELLRHAQEGTRPPPLMADPARAPRTAPRSSLSRVPARSPAASSHSAASSRARASPSRSRLPARRSS
jgi:putative transposase